MGAMANHASSDRADGASMREALVPRLHVSLVALGAKVVQQTLRERVERARHPRPSNASLAASQASATVGPVPRGLLPSVAWCSTMTQAYALRLAYRMSRQAGSPCASRITRRERRRLGRRQERGCVAKPIVMLVERRIVSQSV